MDIRDVTPRYSVAPQLTPEDMAALAEAGFTDVICNRPDSEVPPDIDSTAMRSAAETAGLRFHDNPVVNGALTLTEVHRQGDLLAGTDGRVCAYCRSGTRSIVVWALSRAGLETPDALIAAAAEAGYDISGLRSQIEAMAQA